MSKRYRKLLIFWGLLLALSLAVLLITFGGVLRSGGTPSAGAPDNGPESGDEGETMPDTGEMWSLTLAIVSAVASGGGFLVTTVFAMRDDRR